jgi:hypothetical protein
MFLNCCSSRTPPPFRHIIRKGGVIIDRIFTDSETAFIAFGDYMDMAKALATNLEPKDLNKRLSVVKIPD